MRELKLDYENTIVHIPDLNGFRVGDRVIADECGDHDRFEGVVIGIEMRRVYGSDRLEPCITLLHNGCITDEFKPNDLRKVEPAATGLPIGDNHPDAQAVDRFAAAMKAKLAQKRAEGRGGWDDPEQCHIDYLHQLLHEQFHERTVIDPVDIANIAMMIHERSPSDE